MAMLRRVVTSFEKQRNLTSKIPYIVIITQLRKLGS